nr:MAG TPA: type I neck protein [Caudoviricetes sp.]
MIRISHRGSFKNTDAFFFKALHMPPERILSKYGAAGVEALAANTPVDTGKTAASWSYEIAKTPKGYTIYWKNSNINNGVNIAVILQYGHGTRNGGYVRGIDYINPALAPIFEEIAQSALDEMEVVR